MSDFSEWAREISETQPEVSHRDGYSFYGWHTPPDGSELLGVFHDSVFGNGHTLTLGKTEEAVKDQSITEGMRKLAEEAVTNHPQRNLQ